MRLLIYNAVRSNKGHIERLRNEDGCHTKFSYFQRVSKSMSFHCLCTGDTCGMGTSPQMF